MPDSLPPARRDVGAHPKTVLAAILRTLPEPSRMAFRAGIRALIGGRSTNDHTQCDNGDRSSSPSISGTGSHRLLIDGQKGSLIGDIDLYWQNSFPLIEGWVNDRWREHLKLINDIQGRFRLTGHIGEIGVFHGKLLIAMAHLAEAGSKVTAIDVFDDQSKNIDGAGVGDLAQLNANIQAHGPRTNLDYAFIEADSSALNAADILKLVQDRGPFRMFSVDGCHTAEHTLNDLLTAQECLAPGGVIMLDDMFQPHWPGVTEALGLFYSRYVPRVRPFLYCAHKMFFVGHGWHAAFLRLWSEQFGQQPDAKLTQMYGNTFLCLFP